MIEVVDTNINSLPYPAVSPAESTILQVLSELQALREEISQLRAENQDLKDRIAAQDKRIADLEIQQDKDFDEIANKINEHSEAINKCWQATTKAALTPQPRGEKTKARIAMIDEILKTRGPTTLKELELILKIDPATMTRLLAKLDKRRYEIHERPGDEREKVLRFRAVIR